MKVEEINIKNELDILKQAKIFESKETTHSRILAYFLATKSDFSEKFLEKIGYKTKNINNINVLTEKDNMDIFFESEDFVLVIENKYKDRNRKKQNSYSTKKEEDKNLKDQLKRYEKTIEDKYSNKKAIFVYLRPFLHKLDNKNWHALTYNEVLKILKNVNTDNELDEYKNILANIYKPQKICLSALKEVLNLTKSDILVNDKRGDINGYSINIPLNNFNNKYKCFIEFEHFEKVKRVLWR